MRQRRPLLRKNMGETRTLSVVEIMRALRRYIELRDERGVSSHLRHQKIECDRLIFFRGGLQWQIDYPSPPRSLPGPAAS
jgi:hypothetical protein